MEKKNSQARIENAGSRAELAAEMLNNHQNSMMAAGRIQNHTAADHANIDALIKACALAGGMEIR